VVDADRVPDIAHIDGERVRDEEVLSDLLDLLVLAEVMRSLSNPTDHSTKRRSQAYLFTEGHVERILFEQVWEPEYLAHPGLTKQERWVMMQTNNGSLFCSRRRNNRLIARYVLCVWTAAEFTIVDSRICDDGRHDLPGIGGRTNNGL